MSSTVIRRICIGFLFLTSTIIDAKGTAHRQRRSLVNLSSMVTEITGRQSSDFLEYGNWCGLGGSGRPVDQIDECCQIHDICYNLASDSTCKGQGDKAVYQAEYKWNKAKDGTAGCADEKDKCKSSICMCDAVLTNCLKKNMEFYNSKNLHKLSLFELLEDANWLSNP